MAWFEFSVSSIFVLFAVFHALAAFFFADWLFRKRNSGHPQSPRKPVAVLVAARGFDPSLADMVKALLNQDYPDYEVHLVSDDADGSLQKQLSEITAAEPNRSRLRLETLQRPLESCGMKNSALLVAIENLPSRVQTLALIDTDIVPPKDWISKLTAPLNEPMVGAVTGAQWFEPPNRFEPGTLIRSLWNGAAIVPSCMYANAWAGSMSINRETFDRAGLEAIWQTSIVDDGPIPPALRRIGLRMEFSPTLIMINRESCHFAFVINYLTRMLCWSRLYEATFRNTLAHAFTTILIWIGIFAGMIAAIVQRNWLGVSAIAAGLVTGIAVYVAAWQIVRHAVMKSNEWAASHLVRRTTTFWLYLGILIPITQWLFCFTSIRALFLRRIRWREVTYEIRGPQSVSIVHYAPASKAGSRRSSSI